MRLAHNITAAVELADGTEIEVDYQIHDPECGMVELISAKIAGLEVKLDDALDAELLEICSARCRQDLAEHLAAAAEARAEAQIEARWDR